MTCDVLIIGSGAAGLSAAVTAAKHNLDVIVVEKADVFGGTSAWSGGWLWIPHNPLAERAGIVENPSLPKQYLASELGNRNADPRVDVFLKNGPKMVSFFEEAGVIEWIDGNNMPDFHNTPGHAVGGRSVSVKPFDGRKLGAWGHRLRKPLDVVSLWGMGIAGGADMRHFFNATRHPGSALYVVKRLVQHGFDLLFHGRSTQLVNGNALVAHLLKSAVDSGVRLFERAPAMQLIERQNRVSGALVSMDGQETEITARRGVILATGGFPHDKQRIAKHFAHAPDGVGHFSAAPRENSGDGLRLAENSGAALDFDLSQPGAWAPVSLVPDGKGGHKHFPHLIERAKPGFIAVDAAGQRFVNEADSYHDFMKALLDKTPAGQTPHAWLICDHKTQRRFGLGWSRPFPFPVSTYVRNGYLKRGRTLSALAAACGLPADALVKTVNQFNGFARMGEDPEFKRGDSAYNRAQGHADHMPNPSLGAIQGGPFYAVKIVPGSLGTFAGIKTSPQGQVLNTNGTPIEGLYAAGNDMSSIMGGNYPSGGITLGPGMTFGYLIAHALAQQSVSERSEQASNSPPFKQEA